MVSRRVQYLPESSALPLWCLGGLFSKTEMSEVLTEILKVDPSFDKDSFLKLCERDIIPNILEVSSALSPDVIFFHRVISVNAEKLV